MQTDASETLQTIDRLAKALKNAETAFAGRPPELKHLPPSQPQFQRWEKQVEDQRFHSHQTFTVMVLGEYNAGKSTLLNALLELPTELRLPSGDDPVTARPLRLRYTDEAPHAHLLMSDGSTRPLRTWKEALNRADQRLAQTEQVKEVQLFLHHPLLANTDILDMPGTGTAEFADHTQLTRDYLDNVEMIIWVIGETEPSSEGSKDFRKALRTQAPITIVFNAWGSIHYPDMEIDQDALELGILSKFPEIREDTFTIYARKGLETQEKQWSTLHLPSVFSANQSFPHMLTQLQQQQGYKEAMDDFGLAVFKDFLWENYLDAFDDHRMKVRQQAMATMLRVAEQVRTELEEARKAWQVELFKAEGESERLRQYYRKLDELKNRVSMKIKAVADPYTQEITNVLTQKLYMFIEDKVTPRNLDIWKNLFNREQLKGTLEQQLENEYLFVNQPNNVFNVQAQEFVEDARLLLDAEWRLFLTDIAHTVKHPQATSQHQLDVKSMLERITKEAFEAVQQTIMTIVKSLGALAILVFGSLLAVLLLLIAAPFGFKMGASPQDKAKKRVRDEITSQYPTIKKKLTDIILSQNGIYDRQAQAFLHSMEQDQKQSTAQEKRLQFAIHTLEQLSQDFDLT